MKEDNLFWYELRVAGKPPERRGYHTTFEHNSKLYIYGGHDIREGSMDSLWMIDLSTLSDLERPDESEHRKCEWTLAETRGKEKPGKVSALTSQEHWLITHPLFIKGRCISLEDPI